MAGQTHQYQAIDSEVNSPGTIDSTTRYRSLVFGGLDGVISTFATLCAAMGKNKILSKIF